MSRNKKILIDLLIALTVVTFVAVGTIRYYIYSPIPLKKDITIVIEPKTSLKSMAKLLADNDVINYPYLFMSVVYFSKTHRILKPGEYLFVPGMTVRSIHQKLSKGETIVHKLTVPEGLMTFQILDLVKNAPFLKGEITEEVKEGELLPETYNYGYGDNRNAMIIRMKNAMQEYTDKLWLKYKADCSIKNKQDAIILASIVEKETGKNSERRKVASVFLNRLHKDMMLQSDPTVIYGITNGKYLLNRPLTGEDLSKNTAYNTYKIRGLPPTPIANPGKLSLLAVFDPEITAMLYFVADGTGGHRFAASLAEHNNNVNHWRSLQHKKATTKENSNKIPQKDGKTKK